MADLVAAEEAGLVALEAGTIEFRHPLARAAVYAEASATERREAHAALAAALPDHDVDRRAWHLAAASIGPDERAASALAQAGGRARDRSAYAVAAAAFERGAGLATTDDVRVRLLVASADAALLAGDAARALARLDDAAGRARDELLVAQTDRLRALVAMRIGPVMDGFTLIVGAAEHVADTDPELAIVMLAQGVMCAFYACDTEAMRVAARRCNAIAANAQTRRAQFFAAMVDAVVLVVDGQGEAGAAAARRAVEILEVSDELLDDPELLVWAMIGPLWLREVGAGRLLVTRTVARAREQVAVGVLPRLLQFLARDQATTDQWAAAEAGYSEALRLAQETGQRVEAAVALAGLSWLHARQGREAACREHAAQAGAMCEELGVGFYALWVMQALGDLELGLARPAEAIARHLDYAEALRERGIADVDLSPAPELVEAYVRVGQADDAAPLMADYRARAEAKGQPWALARAARCRGLLAEPADVQSCFERGAGTAPPYAGPVRDGAHAPRLRRAAAAGPPSRPGARAAA